MPSNSGSKPSRGGGSSGYGTGYGTGTGSAKPSKKDTTPPKQKK